MTAQSKAPNVGEEGFILEPHTLSVVLKCLPKEVRGAGSRRQTVIHTCFDVAEQYLAVGSEQGYVWILDLHGTKLIRELNDFRGTSISTMALNTQYDYIAYGSELGQTKIEPFTKQMSKKYHIQEKDKQRVVAMVWDSTGTRLLCAYSSGKLVKVSFQFNVDVMEVVPLLECGSCVVQLSVCGDSLLISTLARSLLLDVDSGRVTQVGTKERKSGSFGGCFSQSSLPSEDGDPVVAFLARPGLRIWTADHSGKVILTTKYRGLLSSGQFPHVPTNNWSQGSLHISDSWTFSLVLSWLQRFIVTYHEHTLCVLDPQTSTVVGVMCLEHQITSIATSGKFVYVLCNGIARPLARFTVHPSYLKSLKKAKVDSKLEGDAAEGGEVSVDRHVTVPQGDKEEKENGKLKEEISETDSGLAQKGERTPPSTPLQTSPPPLGTMEDMSPQNDGVTSHHVEGTLSESGGQPRAPEDLAHEVTAPPDWENRSNQGSQNVEEGAAETSNSTGVMERPDDSDLASVAAQPEYDESTVTEEQSTATSLLEAVDTPILGPAQHDDDTHTQSSDHSQQDREPILDPEPTFQSTQSDTATADSTSSSEPTAIRREVADLLRPALGKLSGLMRYQELLRKESRTSGQNSGTNTPQEPPTINVVDEERADTPVEMPGTSGSKLMQKLGGKIGGFILGDRDKDQDTPYTSALAMPSVGITPAPIAPEEEERRVRMAQAAAEEDTVSERPTQKKRKKRKKTKSSPRASPTSPSLETPTDVGDKEELDNEPAVSLQVQVSPQVEGASDTAKAATSANIEQPLNSEVPSTLSALVETEEFATQLRTKDNKPPGTDEMEPQKKYMEVIQRAIDPSSADEETVQHAAGAVENVDYSAISVPFSIPGQDSHKVMDESSPTSLLRRVSPAPEYHTKATSDADSSAISSTATDDEIRVDAYSPLQKHSDEDRKMLDVALGTDPLSLKSEDENYYKIPSHLSSHDVDVEREVRQSSTTVSKSATKTSSSEHSQQFTPEEPVLELSDNPLYGDDTTTTTDTESSQPQSRQGSPVKLPSSLRSSSLAPPSTSTKFAAKYVNSKGAASLGASPAVSDLSLENAVHVPGDHIFTPPMSPFEVSNSPADLSSSFQSSTSVLQHQSKATSLPPPMHVGSLPTGSTLLHFQESRRSGEDSGSEFSCDENEGPSESEHFSLCAAVDESHSKSVQSRRVASLKTSSALPMPRQRVGIESFFDERDPQQAEASPDPEADIWVTVPHPCRGHVQSICLSDHLLWLVDSRSMVYCTKINSKGKNWELIKHPMQQVSSSASGHVVWGTYRQNAYVRLGVDTNVLGTVWKNVTKMTSLAQRIKYVCADDAGVWAVKNDGQIIFRKGVSDSSPHGRVWVEVGRAAGFTSVTACSGVVWATNASGRLFYRDGITTQNPSGRKWVDMKAPPLQAVCMTQGNIAWIIDADGKMGFRCGVSHTQPTGKNPWWEVTVSTTLPHSSLPFNSLWQVMTSEGSQFLSSVSSLIHTHLPGHHKLLAVSASNKAGVCVLESGSKLHACWRSTSGYHYSTASKDGVFQLTTWTMFGCGSTGLWVVRDDGELYCVTPQEKFVRIECASTVQLMAVSSTAVWVIADNILWSRQGMTSEVPEGISWDYIELSPQLHSHKLRHIVCGKRAVWAIDGSGVPHFRFGVHSREPGTGMSPAWVPVDDLSHLLLQITVSNNDWLVWACDDNYNCYARNGVTPDFPVGKAWDIVPGQPVKQLCAHDKKVYALTPSGNLLCRYGITETNTQGNYWRQLPGNFVRIAVSPKGRLMVMDSKGMILRQQCKTITVSHDSEFLRHQFEEVLDQSWEVV